MVRDIIAALAAVLFVGCAHTSIESTPDQNGVATFKTSDTGIGLFSVAGSEWKKFGEGVRNVQEGFAYAQYARQSTTWTNWTAAPRTSGGNQRSQEEQVLEQYLRDCESASELSCRVTLQAFCNDGQRDACALLQHPSPPSQGDTP